MNDQETALGDGLTLSLLMCRHRKLFRECMEDLNIDVFLAIDMLRSQRETKRSPTENLEAQLSKDDARVLRDALKLFISRIPKAELKQVIEVRRPR